MTSEQILRLMGILHLFSKDATGSEDAGKRIGVTISPFMPGGDGEQKYSVEVRDLTDFEVHPDDAPPLIDETI